MRRIFLLLLCLPAMVLAQALDIIPLQHRSAEQLLPQLYPFVEPGGGLTGMNDRLFLRASRRNQEEIRRLVAELDIPQRRLMISVRQEGEADLSARGGNVDGVVTIQNGRIGGAGTARVYSSSRAASDRTAQQVQTIDGGRASIMVGQSVILPLRQVIYGPGGVVVSQTVVQRDLGTGFVAVPRLAGSRVTIEVSPMHDTPGPTPLSARQERLTTTVSGPLGEWLVLGGSLQDDAGQSGGQSWGSQSASRQRRLLLRVDELP